MNKETRLRNEGIAFALSVAKEKGVDGLEDECKFRGITQIPITYPRSACDDVITRIKHNTIDTMLILAVATLMDEFEFSEYQVRKFIDRFEGKTECLTENYVNWDELIEDIKERTGISLDIRKNEQKN